MPNVEQLKERVGELNRPSLFQVVWTSFGVGFEHGMNPSLASTLSFLTHNVSFSQGKMYFDVYSTDAREDLQLLALLKNSGVKEVYVSLYSRTGVELPLRMKFAMTALFDYNVSLSWEANEDYNVSSTSFTVGGQLDIVGESLI